MSKSATYSSLSERQLGHEAVVAGHICLDLIPTLLGRKIEFLPGKLVEAGAVVTATGGAVSNTGLSLHRLGITTRLMGKIGDDLFGSAVRQIIASHGQGLADGMVVSPGEATSYSIILSPPGSDRMFLHATGCNATFNENDIDYNAVAAARLFHFGYPPLMEQTFTQGGSTLVSIFQNAKAAGVTTSLDFSMPDRSGPAGQVDWRALLKKTLPFVDVCVPSIEELLLMLRPEEYQRLSAVVGEELIDLVSPALMTSLGNELLSLGAKICMIKAGHRGVYLRTASEVCLSKMGRAKPVSLAAWADRELWAPCFLVDVIGTTGSGDATIAGFLMGLLREMSPYQCMTAACAVGGCNVEAADALGGVLSWEATSARIENGWRRLLMNIDSPGWEWNERHAVWTGPFDALSPDAV
ncbi:MAG: carbohydrate kinase family protein [Janthinobacterium lividum]